MISHKTTERTGNSSSNSVVSSPSNSSNSTGNDNNPSTTNTNEFHLNLIATVEEKIVRLVKVAGLVVESLAFEGQDLDDRKEEFVNRHKEFTDLLRDIQKTLRIVFRHLSKAGILASNSSSVKLAGDLTTALQMSSLPYQSTVEGFETDFRLNVQGLHVLAETVRAGVFEVYGDDVAKQLENEGRRNDGNGEEIFLFIEALVLIHSAHAAAPPVKQFQMIISQGSVSPDGVPVTMKLVNGQIDFPIIVDKGDTVSISVVNTLYESTSIHWHGLEMRGYPWLDGAEM
ncbi:UNVERIFIED_CONTAM: hypothetical protein HDU68_004729, partial [Siphonaria sp. JEL0065]